MISKWLLVLVVANLARIGAGGALRCQAGSDDGTTTCAEDATELAVPALPPKPTEPAALPTGVECAAGSTWKSQCNQCACSPNGYAFCTEMACSEKLEEPIFRCAPETRWKYECNTCWCSSQGQAACTLIGCLSFTGTFKPFEVPSTENKEDQPIDSTIAWHQNHYVTITDTGDDLGKLDLNIGERDPNLENIYNFKEANDINTMVSNVNQYDETDNTDYLENDTTHDDFSNIEDLGETIPLVDGNDQDVTDTPFSIASTNNYEEKYINEVVTRAKRGQKSENMELEGNQDYDVKTKGVKKPEYAEGNIKKREEKQSREKSNDDKHFKDNVYSHSENDQDLNTGSDFDYESLEHDDKKREALHIHSLMKQDFSKKPLVKRSVCKPNADFQLTCNSCKCSPDGLSYTCTHNECMEGDSNKEVEVFMENEGGVDHIERHSVCKAAATFYIGCNTCHCNYFGNDYSCTNKPCPLPEDVELFHELKSVKKSSTNTTHKIVCVANRMFIMDCNTCWCNEDGTSFFCTRKVCAIETPEEDGKKKLNIVEATKKTSENPTKEIVCVANSVFHIDCNKCWCNDDGTDSICTRKGCITEKPDAKGRDSGKENMEQHLRIIMKECKPDEVFEIDCNMCRCNPDGLSYSCTRRACVMDEEDRKNNSQIRKTRGVTQEPPKACQAGQSFRMDCNTCLCDNEGQDFSCTRNDCNAVNGNGASATARAKRESTTELIPMECVTDSVFDRDCNVCRCTDGKHAMCTTKRCTAPKKEKEEDVTPLPNVNPDFRCDPGEQFKRGCNDCSCSADGKSVFCTVRFCDQDIAPVPST